MPKKSSEDKIGLDRTDELMRLVFEELKTQGGSGRPKDVLAKVSKRANISPYEAESTKWFKERGLEGPRWDTHIRFWTTSCARAGFLNKSGGIWELTEKGDKALELPKGELIREASRAYRNAKHEESDSAKDEAEASVEEHSATTIYERAVEDARASIDSRLDELDPYEFQQMVAELLKAMGYYVRRVAPPGPDGGVDILAFQDPLGTQPPHIFVQVKHRDQKMDVREIRQLTGVLRKDSDIGLLVSSGGFTKDADREISHATKHMDRIDRERLLKLWTQHYDKLSEHGKKYLPLIPVHFLAPNDEESYTF